jgi:hypothetical protein
MARKKITVRRKAYTRRDGTRVKATTYKMKDRGAPGRGKKDIKIKDPGGLGGPGFLEVSQQTRNKRMRNSIKQDGLTTTIRRVGALKGFMSRTGTRKQKQAIDDSMEYLQRKKKRSKK